MAEKKAKEEPRFHEVIVEVDRTHPFADAHHREIIRRIAEVSPGFSLDELEVGTDAPVHRFRLYWRLPDVQGIADVLTAFAAEEKARAEAMAEQADTEARDANGVDA